VCGGPRDIALGILKFVAEAAREPAIRLIDGRSVGTAQGSRIAA